MMDPLYNKETGVKIANEPEELPPLREGYVRVLHMTHFSQAQSLAENGLVYNGEYAQNFNKDNNTKQKIKTHYEAVDRMAVAVEEEDFWNKLTSETGIRHRGSDAVAIFDMPAMEYAAHVNENTAQFLSGTISRGYMVGMIPNYGTRDMNGFERLTEEEMQKRKKQSLSNPLPPKWETPHWQEDVTMAKNKLHQRNQEIIRNADGISDGESNGKLVPPSEILPVDDSFDPPSSSGIFTDYYFDDNADSVSINVDDSNNTSKDDRNSSDPEIRDKAWQKTQYRAQAKNENKDYLQEKLKNLRKSLGTDDESRCKTAREADVIVGEENRTCENGVIRGTYKRGRKLVPNDCVGDSHIEAMIKSMRSRKRQDK